MKLIPRNFYKITYFNEYSFILHLVRIDKTEYTWRNKYGAEIINKQLDVDKWVKFKEIERL